MRRIGLLLAIVTALSGCENAAEEERKSKADYADLAAAACRDAMHNVQNVENTRSIMGKPEKYGDGRSYAKTVCAEADKAAKADQDQKTKGRAESQ